MVVTSGVGVKRLEHVSSNCSVWTSLSRHEAQHTNINWILKKKKEEWGRRKGKNGLRNKLEF